MAYFTDVTIRVRVRNGTTLGTVVTICYADFELNRDPNLVDTTTNCVLGTREQATRVKPSGSIKYPKDLSNLDTVTATLQPGNVLGFEVWLNPAETTVNLQQYIVITNCTIGNVDWTAKPTDVFRESVAFTSGDFYVERTGRSGFPAPFDSAP